MKELSIIIPIYNVERYLERCLESIRRQVVKKIEVILVNDGSSDGCDAICKKYTDNYPEFQYIKQDNAGVSIARNIGLETASGEYVTFIDPDDTISDTYVQDLLQELTTAPDLLILKYQKINGGVVEDGPYNVWNAGEIDVLRLKKSVGYLFLNEVWNKVFRKKIIDDYHIRFIPAMKIAEDICFVLDYINYIKNAKVAKGIFYFYWSNEGSAIRNIKVEYLDNLMTLYKKLLVFSEKNGLQDGTFNQPSDFTLQCVAELIENGKYQKNDVINSIKKSGIIEIVKRYECHGIQNKLLLYWLSALSKGDNLSARVYKIAIIIYDKVKGIK